VQGGEDLRRDVGMRRVVGLLGPWPDGEPQELNRDRLAASCLAVLVHGGAQRTP
jgi:hypothetical protein